MKKIYLQRIILSFLVILSFFYCLGAIQLKIDSPTNPGPGFLPFLIGIFIGFLCIIELTRSFQDKVKTDPQNSERLLDLYALRKIIIVCGSIGVYAIILPYMGYLISTFILMILLFKNVEPQKWVVALISTIITVTLSYLIFVVWLGSQFPTFPEF